MEHMKLFEEFEPKFKSGIEKDPEGRGEIRWRYYEDGVLTFMGSFVDNKYRGQGIFDKMLNSLLSKQPKGTIVQVPLTKKFLVPYFQKFGFEIIDEPIRYWGYPDNSVNVSKVI